MAKEIVLSGDVGIEITVQGVAIELKAANGADVDFLLNSRGGLVFAGIEMFNLIRAYSGHTRMIITGIAASMASYISLAANEVVAFSNTSWMVHNALGLVLGNHNDMRKRADSLEGISNILAKEYAKKTGESIRNMKALMDNETFLFGDEIKEAGFVDEIREAGEDDDTDRATALITTKASVENCMASMRTSEAANDDYLKAVAYMDAMSLLGAQATAVATDKNKIETPAVAGNIKQEDKHMTFAELLAENPSAKAEHDVLIVKARTEGATEAKDEMKAVIASISPKLMSEAYGQDVKEAGIKAIIGDGPIATFETLVVLADRDTEAAKAKAALEETEEVEETPGATGEKLTDAEAKEAFDAKLERTKEGGSL